MTKTPPPPPPPTMPVPPPPPLPPPPTATLSGLDPEQEIRARALEIAAKVATAEISFPASNLGEVLALAELFAGWIRTGQRPS